MDWLINYEIVARCVEAVPVVSLEAPPPCVPPWSMDQAVQKAAQAVGVCERWEACSWAHHTRSGR